MASFQNFWLLLLITAIPALDARPEGNNSMGAEHEKSPPVTRLQVPSTTKRPAPTPQEILQLRLKVVRLGLCLSGPYIILIPLVIERCGPKFSAHIAVWWATTCILGFVANRPAEVLFAAHITFVIVLVKAVWRKTVTGQWLLNLARGLRDSGADSAA